MTDNSMALNNSASTSMMNVAKEFNVERYNLMRVVDDSKLRCDTQFDTHWEQFPQDQQTTEPPSGVPPPKLPRNLNHLNDSVVDRKIGHLQRKWKSGSKRLDYSTLDVAVGEIKTRLSEHSLQKKSLFHPDCCGEGPHPDDNLRVERNAS
ncbi:unnamed protein product [Lepeophtheirus salmonis]|uniref:(salmon louse) hypothetical protein n=1 Tax=Lepeophtheirus salmonis TaxID=72036 RepID=A0A7R8CDR4_LEPSM|nr:unnamed protein product [Lepeophtheirus salmonis]CAF2782456.1 unnamed protein product [Lepeophtheirus salmonis]